MRKIPVNRAVPGDVLAEPVAHGDGQVLMVAGTRLESSHLETLRVRGVALVTVEDKGGESSSVDPAAAADPELLKEILLEESRWYGEARKQPLLAEVFRFTVARVARERTGE